MGEPNQQDPLGVGQTTDSIAAQDSSTVSSTENTSGQGKGSAVPDGVSGWGWGPFLMSWAWAIGNNVWIGLLVLIPYVGFIMLIILGIKGREWAWQSKHWDSVEHFNKAQRSWATAGVVLLVIGFVVGILVAIAGIAIGTAGSI